MNNKFRLDNPNYAKEYYLKNKEKLIARRNKYRLLRGLNIRKGRELEYKKTNEYAIPIEQRKILKSKINMSHLWEKVKASYNGEY